MKNIFFIIIGFLFCAKTYGQDPVFLSPYKSGKPIPESAKDYSKPVQINLLDQTNKKQPVVMKGNITVQESEPNKIKPVIQNSGKKDIQTK